MSQLAHQAYHDSLTELPNRIQLHDRTDQAIGAASRENSRLAFLLIDLDSFKEINDTLGHDVGDELLRQVGKRLQELMRRADTVARLGGDEFAVLMTVGANEEGAIALARRIEQTLEEPFGLGEITVRIQSSIGISLYPDHASGVTELLKKADSAMYQAKKAGGGAAVYSPTAHGDGVSQLALIAELQDALAGDQLLLDYQPKVSAVTGEANGAEVLIRWAHPRLGDLAPTAFLPSVETTNLIDRLTPWAADRALAQCGSWADEGREVSVAVKVSGRNLLSPVFAENLAEVLATSTVAPDRLILQVGETAVMADLSDSLVVLERFRGLGARVSLDEFGTGRSCLAHLSELPLDEVKIDVAFLVNVSADPSPITGGSAKGRRSVMEAIVDLCHARGLVVVATGVATSAMWTAAAELGCDLVQGTAVCGALEPHQLAQWMKAGGALPPANLRPA